MNDPEIFYREESHLPRLVTWPLIFMGTAVIALTVIRELRDPPQTLVLIMVVGAALGAALLLEFIGLAIEVRETEIRFAFVPFYRRMILPADILHWAVKTQENSPWGQGRYSWRAPKHTIELKMKDGSILTLITEHPQQLLNAIRDAKAKVDDGNQSLTTDHHG